MSVQHTVELKEDRDEVIIRLPGNVCVDLLLSHMEEEALPELDILFPQEVCVNCWDAGLVPAKPDPDKPNVISCVQLIIPIEQLSGEASVSRGSASLEAKMQMAMETKKMFGFIKDEGKWYWANKHDPDRQAGPFDTFVEALDDAVKPYFEGSG